MSSRHAAAPRGLELKNDVVRPAWNQQGRFGRLFEAAPNQSSDTALEALAHAMVSADFDPPRDGKDLEESGIPALYTYFGQFVDHDLTFDPETSFAKRKDPGAMVDFRTPAFDLDSVYGRGPGDQPYLYDRDGAHFELGDPLTLGDAGARDLLRSPAGRALIGDPRNDENVIISQLHGLFLRLHNRLIDARHSFTEAQSIVCRRYQQVVLHDFLPRIVCQAVLEDLKTNGQYDKSKLRLVDVEAPFMPVEFSVACFRFGHSMVRPGYRLNDAVLLPIFPNQQHGLTEGLTGMRRMTSNRGIDWARFIDVEVRPGDGSGSGDDFKRLQFAYRIDTSLVDPLGSLPFAVVRNGPPSLALRNLKRGQQLGLPSAQTVAAMMRGRGVPVPFLSEEQIIIGKSGDHSGSVLCAIDPSFEGHCPLWPYVLAEAMHHAVSVAVPVRENQTRPGSIRTPTPRLGPLGGRIVAEVILGLMFADPFSILNTGGQADGPAWALKDLVAHALGKEGT